MSTAPQSSDLGDAMQTFSRISENLLSSYADLSERAERVEHELCESNRALAQKVSELDAVTRDLEAILEALPVGVVVRDENRRVLRVNTSTCELLRTTPAALLQTGGDSELAEIKDGVDTELSRDDGSRVMLNSRRSDIHTTDGELSGSVQILDDRTEVTALHRRLHALDKAAALGTMAGGIAHEIRNPLNAVQGFATLMNKALHGEDVDLSKLTKWSKMIVEGANEADAIISSMLSFARPKPASMESVDPKALLEKALRSIDQSEADSSLWKIESKADLPPFLGDRILLRQALRNLISNAVNAQASGGALDVQIHLDGAEVVFDVSDAGPGIPEHVRDCVQDPFFTTRAEGTGLGLALANTIAQMHGGRLEVHSSPSHLGGALVTLRIPFTPVS